jgi:hypothetical protein
MNFVQILELKKKGFNVRRRKASPTRTMSEETSDEAPQTETTSTTTSLSDRCR